MVQFFICYVINVLKVEVRFELSNLGILVSMKARNVFTVVFVVAVVVRVRVGAVPEGAEKVTLG
jgi:hypothetical protein